MHALISVNIPKKMRKFLTSAYISKTYFRRNFINKLLKEFMEKLIKEILEKFLKKKTLYELLQDLLEKLLLER